MNTIELGKILRGVDSNERIKKLFYISDVYDLNKLLSEFPLQKEGYLTWSEFLELLFQHKRTVKHPPTPEKEPEHEDEKMREAVRSKYKKMGVKKPEPVLKKRGTRGAHSLKRAKSVKPRQEPEMSFEEKKLEEYVLSGKDYKKHYKSVSKSFRGGEEEPGITIPKPFKFADRDTTKKGIRQRKLDEMVEEKIFFNKKTEISE